MEAGKAGTKGEMEAGKAGTKGEMEAGKAGTKGEMEGEGVQETERQGRGGRKSPNTN